MEGLVSDVEKVITLLRNVTNRVINNNQSAKTETIDKWYSDLRIPSTFNNIYMLNFNIKKE